MQIVASFEAPIELLSVNKRTATEIKFEVQNTAAGRKAAFILGFKGGDVGASHRHFSVFFICSHTSSPRLFSEICSSN